MHKLHNFFKPLLGGWLDRAMIVVGYFNTFTQVGYFLLNYYLCPKPDITSIYLTSMWIFPLMLVCLAGIKYKNFHSFFSFFLALVFLVANVVIMVFRFKT